MLSALLQSLPSSVEEDAASGLVPALAAICVIQTTDNDVVSLRFKPEGFTSVSSSALPRYRQT